MIGMRKSLPNPASPTVLTDLIISIRFRLSIYCQIGWDQP